MSEVARIGEDAGYVERTDEQRALVILYDDCLAPLDISTKDWTCPNCSKEVE